MHRPAPLSNLLAAGLLALAAGCTTAHPDKPVPQPKLNEATTGVVLCNGRIRVIGKPAHLKGFDVSPVIELRKINHDRADYTQALLSVLGSGPTTMVNVPGTSYQFIFLGGAVQPLILDNRKGEVWQVSGLGKHFSGCRSIGADAKPMTFACSAALPDTGLKWVFDFSDAKQGLAVRFTAEGGW